MNLRQRQVQPPAGAVVDTAHGCGASWVSGFGAYWERLVVPTVQQERLHAGAAVGTVRQFVGAAHGA